MRHSQASRSDRSKEGPVDVGLGATTFTGAFGPALVLARIRASMGVSGRSVDAVLPSSRRATLMKFQSPQPLWYRN
jgi:hypothetical protein